MNAYENLALDYQAGAPEAAARSKTDLTDPRSEVADLSEPAYPTDDATAESGLAAVTLHGVKVAISLLWYSGASLSRGLTRLAGRSPKARFVVLYYHEVPEEARAGFARQMQALSRGTTVLRAAHAGALPDGGFYVAITFDDAFRSVRANAVPELLRRGLPATIFVPVGCLGEKPGWETQTEVNEQVMTCDELRSLPELIELGSHSLSHPHLTRIDTPSLLDELAKSREKLAEVTGGRVSLLAFPYGEYDDRVVGTSKQAGYERAFGIDPTLVDPAGREFVRGRVPVDLNDGRLLFFLKARGAYGWMIHASAIKRRLASWRRSR